MAKRFLKTTVVSVIFALTLAVSASAATAGGATTTTAVNFRTGAGTNYGIISTLPAGTHVVVSERSSGNWATVVYNGTVGYISSDYLKRANDMDASFGTGTICGSYVRMRSSASTSSSILGTYNSGTTMTVTGVSGAWYKVDYNGTDGYVYSNYLSLSGVTSSGGSASGSNGSVKGSDVRMRSGPGTNYSILGTYQNGTALTLDVPASVATFRCTMEDLTTMMNNGINTLVFKTEKTSTTLNLSLLTEGYDADAKVKLHQCGSTVRLSVNGRGRRDLLIGR